MRFRTKPTAGHGPSMFLKCKAVLARCIRSIIEARKSRAEHEREFYRKLRDYCQAHDLSPVCVDDWKTHS
jgi:hypothetical protein